MHVVEENATDIREAQVTVLPSHLQFKSLFFFCDPLIQGGGGEQTLSVHGKRWESSSILSGGRICGPVMLFRNDSVGVQRRLQPGSEVPFRSFSKQTNYMPEPPGNAQAWLHLRLSGDKDLGNVIECEL